MKTFVIHLERATARRQQVDHIIQHTPNAEVLPACDGSALSTEERDAIYPGTALFRPRYPFDLSNGEIGCFESHKAAWRKIVAEKLEYALIVEDDVHVDPSTFEPALELATKYAGQWGYAQFQVRPVEDATRIQEGRDGVWITRSRIIPLRTSAQLVSHEAAQKLLSVSEQIDRPVDAFLQMRWATGVEITCMVPSGVSDRTAETGGSTLSKKRGILDELKVTLPRLQYRRAIRNLSAKS